MSTVENKSVDVEQKQPVKGKKKNNADKRQFTVTQFLRDGLVQDFKGGSYQAATPSGAARKAAHQGCKQLYGDEDCVVDVGISETTKNRPSKEYSYRATRTYGTKNVNFKESGVNIPFQFSIHLKSLRIKKDGKKEVVDEATAVEENTVVEENTI